MLTPHSIGHAVLFGALISATDPVAVLPLFEELGVPARLKMLVAGESIWHFRRSVDNCRSWQ